MDYDIAELSLQARERSRKSYPRDSHGFEQAENYFQDISSDEDSTNSSTVNSFTLSLGRDPKRHTSPRHHGSTVTKTRSTQKFSPSPSATDNRLLPEMAVHPKRLTFETESSEEAQTHTQMDDEVKESVSESEYSDDHVDDEETLPGVSHVEPSPRSRSPIDKSSKSLRHSQQQKSPGKSPSTSKAISPKQRTAVTQQSKHKASPKPAHQKATRVVNGATRQRAFELGTFSDSSSESDEDVATIKRSLFVKPIGGNTLMCLPKLSEYTQRHEDTHKDMQKTVSFKHKPLQDRKKKAIIKKENKTVQVKVNQKKRKTKEVVEEASDAASEREDSESQTDNETRAVKTERNPKLKNRRSIASTKVNTKAVPPTRKPSSVTKSSKMGDQSDASLSDTSQKSFASLRNASSKIIETMYDNGDQELEHDITNCGGEKTRPNVSFTSAGQNQRLTRSNVKHKQTVNVSVTKPAVVTVPQSSRKRHVGSNDTDTETKRQKIIKVPNQTEQRDTTHSSAESGDNAVPDVVPDVVPQKEAAKSKHIKSKAVSNNVTKVPPSKAKLKKKSSRQAKKRQLVTEMVLKDKTMLNGENDEADGLRRSKRTRVPTLNRLLGEEVFYVASPSGGHVVDRVIRHNEVEPITAHYQQQKHQRQPVKPKAPAKPKTDIERPKTSASAMVRVKREKPPKKDKTHKKAKLANQHRRLQVVEKKQEDEAVISEEAAMAEQSPLREVAMLNEGMMVDQLMMEDDRPGGSDMAAVVDVKHVRRVPPESPRAKENLGNSLMKAMFQPASIHCTESVEIIDGDGMARAAVDVVKPLQSMQLVTDDGKPASPSDPFVMAILVRQKSFNFGSIILNKMGEKSEQFTRDSSVYFFLISGEIMLKIGDLELHPPVWSRMYIPEGVSYSLKNLQHSPAVMVYVVNKRKTDK